MAADDPLLTTVRSAWQSVARVKPERFRHGIAPASWYLTSPFITPDPRVTALGITSGIGLPASQSSIDQYLAERLVTVEGLASHP